MSEHGIIGAENPQTSIVDLTGLHDRATLERTPIATRLLQTLPDAIWLPHRDARALFAAIHTDSTFWAEYDYYPGCFDYGFAIRKTSPLRPRILAAARDVWQAVYGAPCPGPATPSPHLMTP